jgi:hypothetical protein
MVDIGAEEKLQLCLDPILVKEADLRGKPNSRVFGETNIRSHNLVSFQ